MQCAQEACVKFEVIKQKWVLHKGESYRYAIKDKSEFTEFMLAEIEGNIEIENEIKEVSKITLQFGD